MNNPQYSDDYGTCNCNCEIPQPENYRLNAAGQPELVGYIGPQCQTPKMVHRFDPNEVQAGERRGAQCGSYGDVQEITIEGQQKEVCVSVNGGRLDSSGRFNVAPRTLMPGNPGGENQCGIDERGVDQCSANADAGYANTGICNLNTGQCECNVGFRGPQCNERVNACGLEQLDCGAHGECVATIPTAEAPTSSAYCRCTGGWSGPHCENPPDPCGDGGLDCGGVCRNADGNMVAASNQQQCEALGHTWSSTGYCMSDPLNPEEGRCICTQGFDHQYYPDGTKVSEACVDAPDLCDGVDCGGDCEIGGVWNPLIENKGQCLGAGGTWHSHGECVEGRCVCKNVEFVSTDGSSTTSAPAWRGNMCQTLTSNCTRAADDYCSGKGQCLDKSGPVPLCKLQTVPADMDPEHAYLPWLLTETACAAGGGVWTPAAEFNSAVGCACDSDAQGLRCLNAVNSCDVQGADRHCGLDETGHPSGYCEERTDARGNPVANCKCVGGYRKPDGSQGQDHEQPSSAACTLGPTIPTCSVDADCIGDHVRCTKGRCLCTDGYVHDYQGHCTVAPSFCYDPDAPANNYIKDCNGHGSCHEGKCNCLDGWTGTECETPPNVCLNVNCGPNSTCSVSNGQPVCVCTGGYTMNPVSGLCDVSPSACDPGPAGCQETSTDVEECHQNDGNFLGCDCAPGVVDKDSDLCTSVDGIDGSTPKTFLYGCGNSYNSGAQKCDHTLNKCEIAQETCNGHGTPTLIIASDGSKECGCTCDPPWTGEKCDTINPCIIEDDSAPGGQIGRNCGACGICRPVAAADGSIGPNDYECQCMDGVCHNQDDDPKKPCERRDDQGNVITDLCTRAAQLACANGTCQYDPSNPEMPRCECRGQWRQDDDGYCTVDPCTDYDDGSKVCGEHGVCVTRGDAATCHCEEGYMYDPDSGQCDLQCSWGTYGANCAKTYDICHAADLPPHVKERLQDETKWRQGTKPDWADAAFFSKNMKTGRTWGPDSSSMDEHTGTCEVQRFTEFKEGVGNVDTVYPLVYCNGRLDDPATNPDSPFRRWIKGENQGDNPTISSCINRLNDTVQLTYGHTNDKAAWLALPDKGNSECGRAPCGATMCAGQGTGTGGRIAFNTGSNRPPSEGQEFARHPGGSLPGDGTYVCNECSSGDFDTWNSTDSSWETASGVNNPVRSWTNCKQDRNSMPQTWWTCNDCTIGTDGSGVGKCKTGCVSAKSTSACWFGDRYICVCPDDTTDVADACAGGKGGGDGQPRNTNGQPCNKEGISCCNEQINVSSPC